MKFVSLPQISHTLIRWTKVEVGLSALSILVHAWFLYDLYNPPEGYNPEIDLIASELWVGLVSLVQVIVIFITLILLLRWVYHFTKTLSQKHHLPLSNSPGWAVGYFFIPILNLFKPYSHVKEMWYSLNPKKASPDFVNYWWGAFLLSAFLGNITFLDSIENWSAVSSITDIQFYLASEVVNLVLAMLTIKLVHKFSAAYQARCKQSE